MEFSESNLPARRPKHSCRPDSTDKGRGGEGGGKRADPRSPLSGLSSDRTVRQRQAKQSLCTRLGKNSFNSRESSGQLAGPGRAAGAGRTPDPDSVRARLRRRPSESHSRGPAGRRLPPTGRAGLGRAGPCRAGPGHGAGGRGAIMARSRKASAGRKPRPAYHRTSAPLPAARRRPGPCPRLSESFKLPTRDWGRTFRRTVERRPPAHTHTSRLETVQAPRPARDPSHGPPCRRRPGKMVWPAGAAGRRGSARKRLSA